MIKRIDPSGFPVNSCRISQVHEGSLPDCAISNESSVSMENQNVILRF